MEFPNLHCKIVYFASLNHITILLFSRFFSKTAQLIVVSALQGLCEQVQSGGCKLRNSDQKRKFLPGEVHTVPIQSKGSKLPGELMSFSFYYFLIFDLTPFSQSIFVRSHCFLVTATLPLIFLELSINQSINIFRGVSPYIYSL